MEQEILGMLEGGFAPPFGFPGSKFSRAKRARKEMESGRRERWDVTSSAGGRDDQRGD